MRTDFVGIIDGQLVYIGIADRTKFDLLDLPATDHGDGPRGHVISKSIEEAGVRVVFQHWVKAPATARREHTVSSCAARARDRAARDAPPAGDRAERDA
jgi:hypothetical protein